MSYKQKETLEKLYVNQGLSQSEIADRFDVDQTTISRWIDKHGIKRPLEDAQILIEMYHENDMSLRDIANEIDSYPGSVAKAMERHGIKRDKPEKDKTPTFQHANSDGHEVWRHSVDGKQYTVRVHRLACVAEYGIEKVKGMDVHHTNGIPWDNRTENYELLTHWEHSKNHANQRERENGRFV